jgi:hypothetical protein
MGGFVSSVVGSVTDIVDDVVGTVGDVVNGAVDAVGDLGKSVDGFVNDNIPGGWATVGIAAGVYFGPEMLAAEGGMGGGVGATSTTTGVASGSLVAAPTATNATITAATEGAGGLGTGTFGTTGAVEGSQFVTQGGLNAAPTVGQGVSSITGESFAANQSALAQSGQLGAATTLTGEMIPAAGGAAAGTAAAATDYLTAKGGMDLLTESGPNESSAKDSTAAGLALMGLITKRRADSMTRRDTTTRGYATGGTVVDQPLDPVATSGNAAVTDATDAKLKASVATAGAATQAKAPTQATADEVSAPKTVTTAPVTATTSQSEIEKQLGTLAPAAGKVATQDLTTAETQVPTTTAVSTVQAAQGEAAKVEPVAQRTAQAGEMVSGTAVDQNKVNAALAQNVAAQGTVTEDMTTQGQLNKILTNFDAGSPPPWAASSMRAATAQLAARGLGASSLAGQAIIQAALEAATPIAAADAKVFENMGLTNLSNRQAMAITTAQQRATFLGQEFDQNFQTKVLNAAKISDIANKNFDATVQIALENAQLANTMNVANLSAKQAVVMANAAQIANLETTNLNNRQQAAVENAKAFLAMDMKNVDLEQQTKLFKAQDISTAILSDTAAQNAAKATNATLALDADKVNAQLALTADQYNAAERNKVSLANMAVAADIVKFNAQEANDRADFNANLSTQVNMANAKIIADISTANTRETNAMAAVNAKNATDLSASTYAQLSQTYRDKLELAWKTGDNDLQRAAQISATTITANATKYSAEQNADAQFYAAVGNAVAKVGTSGGGETLIDWITKKVIG